MSFLGIVGSGMVVALLAWLWISFHANQIIFALIRQLLRVNDAIYGRGASREVLRDLAGEWSMSQEWHHLTVK